MLKWKETAACRGVDPEVFFPVNDDDAAPAKEICATCPAQERCLEYALANKEQGVWGGMTERERRNFLKRSKRIKARDGKLVPGYDHRYAVRDTKGRFQPRQQAS